jgi:hypothetical protein
VVGKKSQELYTGKQNKGVEERNKRDEQQHKDEEAAASWEHAQEKLRQKTELYDKMGMRHAVRQRNKHMNNLFTLSAWGSIDMEQQQ